MDDQNKNLEGQEEAGVGTMAGELQDEGAIGSSLTMERVAAAKQFIENHYKAQRKHIQERKERFLLYTFVYLIISFSACVILYCILKGSHLYYAMPYLHVSFLSMIFPFL